MTPLQDKLRAAFRQTADEIPDQAPPLHLSPQSRAGQDGRHTRWRAWAAPLAAAALVIAAIAGTLAVAASLKHQPATAGQSAGPYGVPAYYVALITAQPRSDVQNDLDSSSWTDTAAELRSTQTGAVLAKVTPPKPYASFTGVTAAADDRTFVLSAQGPLHASGVPPYPAQRFFVLRIDPAARGGARMTLTALPAKYVPAGNGIHDMALSPAGTQLAADIGADPPFDQRLYVFDLATGAERTWSVRTCAKCAPGSGGMIFSGVNTDALSWTADSQHIAFIWGSTVRLLDTRAEGSDLLTDSRTVVTSTGRQALDDWRGAVITPDGRTVFGIEQLEGTSPTGPIREELATWTAVTGRQTAVLNNLNARKRSDIEQILYTSADGGVLVLSYLRPGTNATIVHDGRDTSIPWSRYIAVAAW